MKPFNSSSKSFCSLASGSHQAALTEGEELLVNKINVLSNNNVGPRYAGNSD